MSSFLNQHSKLLAVGGIVTSTEVSEVVADCKQVVFQRFRFNLHRAALSLELDRLFCWQVGINDEFANVQIVQRELNQPTSASLLRF